LHHKKGKRPQSRHKHESGLLASILASTEYNLSPMPAFRSSNFLRVLLIFTFRVETDISFDTNIVPIAGVVSGMRERLNALFDGAVVFPFFYLEGKNFYFVGMEK
jgi:hypothetical protein